MIPLHLYPRFSRVLRYGFSGLTVAALQFAAFVFFIEWLGLWYLQSSVLAFFLAVALSFTLQKYWTFKSSARTHLFREVLPFFILALLNLAANAGLMYLLVETFAIGEFLAQAVVMGMLATVSYFSYRTLFSHKNT